MASSSDCISLYRPLFSLLIRPLCFLSVRAAFHLLQLFTDLSPPLGSDDPVFLFTLFAKLPFVLPFVPLVSPQSFPCPCPRLSSSCLLFPSFVMISPLASLLLSSLPVFPPDPSSSVVSGVLLGNDIYTHKPMHLHVEAGVSKGKTDHALFAGVNTLPEASASGNESFHL